MLLKLPSKTQHFICRECRLVLWGQFHSSATLFRNAGKTNRKSDHRRRHELLPGLHTKRISPKRFNALTRPNPEEVRNMLLRNFVSWKSADQTKDRFQSLGLDTGEVQILLNEYEPHIIKAIKSEVLQGDDPWSVAHLLHGETINEYAIADRVFTMRIFPFATQQGLTFKGIRAASIAVLRQASEAFDLRYPPEVFIAARRMRRKIYLHVGPTNSGKTYNALRALANARTGVYAGPLRLLAHEVWERLNRGSFRPPGTDPLEAHKYSRPCNLITGEEQRIVSDHAPLTSCTVEMINLQGHYDVCVIDEIQMISDPERGFSWTAALLGVPAEEVHLCGEEAAVPLIRELMGETGDDLEIKRYERLTPLLVADKSLQGRWDLIQKGDCVVTFSRTSIFTMKRVVEEATGLRCAVAYGRLPPETRSEQAALFNDPDSGYDVMVASDAIGMGLNLKIKRVVFVQLTKFNGTEEVYLSLSQIKQIGGRAGRFQERGDASPAGIVTCLNQKDLPILKKAFTEQQSLLHQAYLPLHNTELMKVAQFLPESSGLRGMHSLLAVAARIGKNYSFPDIGPKLRGMDVIDQYAKDLQLIEKMQFVMAPTAWRATIEYDVFVRYLQQYVDGKVVDLRMALRDSGLLGTLESVSEARLDHERRSKEVPGTASGYSVQKSSTLAVLETLHRVLVTYAWLSFRVPISFDQRGEVAKLKEETEKGIEFVLEGIASVRETQQQEVKSMQELRAKAADKQITYEPRRAKIPMLLERAGLARREARQAGK